MVIRNASGGGSGVEADWPRCEGGLGRGVVAQVAMATSFLIPVSAVDVHQLASVIRNRIENVLIIDSRSFIEHNACHIATAVNVCCSKIVKRRLQQDKLSVKELLMHTCHCDVDDKFDVVVYDQSSKNAESLGADSFTVILLKKLQLTFRGVTLLTGGFDTFQENYPDLCEDKTRKCPPLSSLSQPCLPIANQGPTRILPFLYLGSQFDALNRDLLKDHNITYELNVSTTCPQPEFVQEGHFMRIPVNDNYSEKLLPYFPEAFNFLDKVREGSGCVLVHCLAGISRSPTVAIAYVMRYLRLTSDDGYRYVKSKRPTISPNFNFLGQLLEYEKQLRRENVLDAKPEIMSAPPLCSKKRLCRTDMRTTKLSLDINTKVDENTNIFLQPRSGDQSPTTALAKLSFGTQQLPEEREEINRPPCPDFRQYRSKSCYGDWLRDREDSMVERKARECNVATSSKILSPVKEIKCDALISEISTGQGEINLKSRGIVRQRVASTRRSSEERHLYVFSQFFSEKTIGCLSDTEEKFSLQTLSHISSKSNMMVHQERSKTNEQQQSLKLRTSPSRFGDTHQSQNEFQTNKLSTENRIFFPETGNKRICHISLDRTVDLSLKKEKTEPDYVFSEHSAPKYKPMSSLHPFSFETESYRRSDSAGTSGFGSESSDCTDNYSDCSHVGKKPENLKLEIDIEDLEDDVILRNNGIKTKCSGANSDRDYFSLTFPEVAVRQCPPGLESPLSPSESHLLEDLEMDKEMNSSRTEPSSPIESDHHSEDPDSFHDSGVPLSPSWIWPRKRVATFDNNHSATYNDAASKDKRRYEPLSEPFHKDRESWFQNINKKQTKQKENCWNMPAANAYQDNTSNGGKMGLYRVQSCPGILSGLSASSTTEYQSNKSTSGMIFPLQKRELSNGLNDKAHCHRFSMTEVDFSKDMTCHESCPDVLHLGSLEMLPHRQRDFRRNVRMVRVS